MNGGRLGDRGRACVFNLLEDMQVVRTSIWQKLFLLLLVFTLVATGATGYLGYKYAEESLKAEIFDSLVSIRDIKKEAIKRYFGIIRNQIITFSENGMVVEAMKRLPDASRAFRKENHITAGELERMRREIRNYYTNEFTEEYMKKNKGRSPDASNLYKSLGPDSVALQYAYILKNNNPLGSKHLLDHAADSSVYSRLHARFHPIIRNYLERFGYYDIFLVESETGNIVYSVYKELDFSTSLKDGPYSGTNIDKVFRKANASGNKDSVVLVDFEFYTPSYEEPASFIASPVFHGGKKIGIVIFQMPFDRISQIMQTRSGMGATGETFLIGPELLLRSDSRFFNESTVLKMKIEREASRRAIAGKTGIMELLDYRDVHVLNAYAPVDIPGLNWGIIAKVDSEEAFSSVNRLKDDVMVEMLIVVLVILIVSTFVAKRFTDPILALDQSLKEMAITNKYGKKLPVTSGDELGSLIESFNWMSGQIERQTREIEEKNEQLSSKTKDLELANKDMESFLYNISHDLKSPVISLKGMVALLETELDEGVSDNTNVYMNHIRASISLMSELLEDLLEVSRVGWVDVTPEPVDTNGLVEEVVAEETALASEKHISFRIQQDMPFAIVNRKRLHQIFSNLVDNAIKFMPATVDKPLVEIGSIPSKNDVVEFYVRDNGEGIDPKHQYRIFEMFQRLHGRDVPGTGMGLALVKKIVESIGGSIRLESKPGHGSTFYLTVQGRLCIK